MNTTAIEPAPTLRFSKARVIAARLGVCTRTLFRWADQGRIARHKVNARLVLFDVAEVESFIQSTRTR
jgi:excisionase family DNA binding protein